jgi:hypothetical protein
MSGERRRAISLPASQRMSRSAAAATARPNWGAVSGAVLSSRLKEVHLGDHHGERELGARGPVHLRLSKVALVNTVRVTLRLW